MLNHLSATSSAPRLGHASTSASASSLALAPVSVMELESGSESGSESDASAQSNLTVSVPGSTTERNGYGEEHVFGNAALATFVNRKRVQRCDSWRWMSTTYGNLPWKSDVTGELLPVSEAADATRRKYNVQSPMMSEFMKSAEMVARWETHVFCNNRFDYKYRRVLARKLFLTVDDTPPHHGLDLIGQGEHFSAINSTAVARWLAPFCIFSALDVFSRRILPMTALNEKERVVRPEVKDRRMVPLPADAVRAYKQTLGNWPAAVNSFVDAVLSKRHASGSMGLFDMVQYGFDAALGSVAMCNIGCTMLAFRYLLKVDHYDRGDKIVVDMSKELQRQALSKGRSLPPALVGSQSRSIDMILPMLCAATISPLMLVSGPILFGRNAPLKPHQVLAIWQHMGFRDRPAILKRVESAFEDMFARLTFCAEEDINGPAEIVALAKQLKEIMSEHPTDPQLSESAFFENIVTSKASEKNKKKKQKKKARLTVQGSQLATRTDAGNPAPIQVADDEHDTRVEGDDDNHGKQSQFDTAIDEEVIGNASEDNDASIYNFEQQRDEGEGPTISTGKDKERAEDVRGNNFATQNKINGAKVTHRAVATSEDDDMHADYITTKDDTHGSGTTRATSIDKETQHNRLQTFYQNSVWNEGTPDLRSESPYPRHNPSSSTIRVQSTSLVTDLHAVRGENAPDRESGSESPKTTATTVEFASNSSVLFTVHEDQDASLGARESSPSAAYNGLAPMYEDEPVGNPPPRSPSPTSSISTLDEDYVMNLHGEKSSAFNGTDQLQSQGADTNTESVSANVHRPSKIVTPAEATEEGSTPRLKRKRISDEEDRAASNDEGDKSRIDHARKTPRLDDNGLNKKQPVSSRAPKTPVHLRKLFLKDAKLGPTSTGFIHGNIRPEPVERSSTRLARARVDKDWKTVDLTQGNDYSLKGDFVPDVASAIPDRATPIVDYTAALKIHAMGRPAGQRELKAAGLDLSVTRAEVLRSSVEAENEEEMKIDEQAGDEQELTYDPLEEKMLLYDVTLALPRTIVNQGSKLVRAIDANFTTLKDINRDVTWIDRYSSDSWQEAKLSNIERNLSRGHAILISDTDTKKGWKFDMVNARRIRQGVGLIDVQDFADGPDATSGVVHRNIHLRQLVDPAHRDDNKVYNLLSAPQTRPLVEIPRQSELDFGGIAHRARQEIVGQAAGPAEHELDYRILSGSNWAIISQKHATSLGHIDTAGVYTAITILDGIKYWAIRKTVLEGRDEPDVDDTEYFVDLDKRDFDTLPGGSAVWVALILFPGDILILPPCARHMVYAVAHTMMSGIHFFSHVQLKRSLCGFICTAFTGEIVTNADHGEFLSIIQASATLWAPCYSHITRETMSVDEPALRTCPEPSEPGPGLDNIVTLATALVFNDTLSTWVSTYRGAYYQMDTANFAFIWRTLAEEGYIRSSDLNADIDFEETLRPHLLEEDRVDNRWTCAGLAEVLLHVGRAIVHLSYVWEHELGEPTEEHLESEQYRRTRPDYVYEHVVTDISVALYIKPQVVELLLGPRETCKDLLNSKIFPTTEWCPTSHRSTRPPCLWDAVRLTSQSVDKESRQRARSKGTESRRAPKGHSPLTPRRR